MSFKIQPATNASKILAELSKTFKRDGDRISWPSDSLASYTFALLATLKISPRVDDHLKDAVIWKTINTCARAGNFSVSFFVRSLRKDLEEFDSNTAKRFSVVCQLNVMTHTEHPKRLPSIYGPIELERRIQNWELEIANNWRPDWREYIGIRDNFLFLRTRFSSKNERSAIDFGYRNIQCAIGLMNLVTGGYGLTRRMGVPDVPLGKLLSASGCVLSDKGTKGFGGWLTENHFPHQFSLFTISSVNLLELPKFMDGWVRRIKATDFVEKLTSSIILFQEGLSATHIDTALLKFWTCIELLCQRTDGQDSHERVIERAASIFAPVEMSRLRLRFIADTRHAVVHRGESDHALLCAQWGSLYAGQLISFCVLNGRLKKHTDIIDYLNTPTSKDQIDRILAMHRLRLRTIMSKKIGLRAKN